MQHSLDLVADNQGLPARYPHMHQYHQPHLSIHASHNTDYYLHRRAQHLNHHTHLSIYSTLTRPILLFLLFLWHRSLSYSPFLG